MAAILSTSFAVAVTDWAATWPLASVAGVQIGHVCVADSELAQVTGVGPATKVTVRRGIEGTAAAAHATNTPVAVYRGADVRTGDPVESAAATAPLRQAVATLTNAQVKALPGSSEALTLIVAAPGVNQLLVVHRVITIGYFAGGGYTNLSADAQLLFAVGTLAGYWDVTATLRQTVTAFFGATPRITDWPVNTLIKEVGTSDLFYQEPKSLDVAEGAVNAPLSLYAYNGLGNLTGGHAANTLLVSVLYSVLDVTTGLWV